MNASQITDNLTIYLVSSYYTAEDADLLSLNQSFNNASSKYEFFMNISKPNYISIKPCNTTANVEIALRTERFSIMVPFVLQIENVTFNGYDLTVSSSDKSACYINRGPRCCLYQDYMFFNNQPGLSDCFLANIQLSRVSQGVYPRGFFTLVSN